MTVSAIQKNRNDRQKNNHWVKPVGSDKNSNKTNAAECSYQLLQQQAIMAYQR